MNVTAVNTLNITVFIFSWAILFIIPPSAFDTAWSLTARVLCVIKTLTVFALKCFSTTMRWVKYNTDVHKQLNFVYVFIVVFFFF